MTIVPIIMGKNSVDSEGAFGRVPHDIEVQQRPRRPIQGSVARASFALHGSVCQKPFNLEGVDFKVDSRC